jgi:HEAT repeat protein
LAPAARPGALLVKQPLIRDRIKRPPPDFQLPAVPAAPASALAAVPPGGDESALKALKIDTTDDALLNFFRKRTPPAPSRERMTELVKKLSAGSTTEQDEAQGELICIGPGAVPLLRQAANNVDDVTGSARARACLAAIEGRDAPALAMNAARLLAVRKPEGATAVLLGYLPYADSDETFADVEAALIAVSVRGGKADPALLRALKDRVAVRRGAAAEVLCKAGGTAHHAVVRPLLKDPKVSVRLRAALGLVGSYDPEAIPVLIDLLADLAPRQRQQAEGFLTQLAGEWAVRGPAGNDALSRELRRDIWKAWWKQAEGERLLAEITSRTLSDAERDKVLALIDKLGDDNADARNAAAEGLISLGKKAAPLLRRTVRDERPKVAPLAARCLEAIEKDSPSPLPSAAPRLLGLRRPKGTVEALIAYLPFTESEELTRQVIDVLSAVGVTGGKADEALVDALQSKIAIRRAGAAVALAKGNALDNLPAVRKLLKDKDVDVRRRTAVGLAAAGDKSAVPVLIALLADLPLDQAFEVEDYLIAVAGGEDKAPPEAVAGDSDSRTRAVTAWNAWWKANSRSVNLTRVGGPRRELGYLLVVENYNPSAGGRGRVLELDAKGAVLWEHKNISYPMYAQVLRNGNVLTVENSGNRLVERDKTGRELSGRYFNSMISCERLRNGNTFLACRNQLMEIDKDGRTVFNRFHGGNQLVAARRFRDGSLAYVDYSGNYYRIDRAGKQLKALNLNWAGFSIGGAEVLPGDRVVVSINNLNKVIEYDAAGKPVWECSVTAPLAPFRLSNGHTLVASNYNTQVTEIDGAGKVAKTMTGLSYRPYRVQKR